MAAAALLPHRLLVDISKTLSARFYSCTINIRWPGLRCRPDRRCRVWRGVGYAKCTDKRAVGPDEFPGKLQSTAGRGIERHAVQCSGLPRPRFDARIDDSHLVTGWSAHWTILRTAQPAHPLQASKKTGSIRGKKLRHI